MTCNTSRNWVARLAKHKILPAFLDVPKYLLPTCRVNLIDNVALSSSSSSLTLSPTASTSLSPLDTRKILGHLSHTQGGIRGGQVICALSAQWYLPAAAGRPNSLTADLHVLRKDGIIILLISTPIESRRNAYYGCFKSTYERAT